MIKEIKNIKDIKIENNGGFIVGIVKDYNVKKTKNGKEYIEGIIEDKTGNIKFKIFDEKEINVFKELLNSTIKVENKEVKNIIKFDGIYQTNFKNFLVNKVLPATVEEYVNYIETNKNLDEKIVEYLLNKKFNNNLYDYLYKNIVIENINKLKEIPNTKYKSFNWNGGLLERNFLLYNQVKNSVLVYKKIYEDIDIELLELVSLIKDIPAKLIALEKIEDDYKLNKIGKLLSTEYITEYTVHKLSEEFLDNFLNSIKSIEKEIEELKDENKINELKELLKIKKEELNKYDEDFIKILHIIETSNYYFNENENKFPRFIEGQIFANTVFSFSNITFFIQEYDKLKDNNKEGEIFSSKFGKYLY